MEVAEILKYAWVLIVSLLWYDKKRSDKRVDSLEAEVRGLHSDTKVLAAEMNNIKELLTIRFDGVSSDLSYIKETIRQAERER